MNHANACSAGAVEAGAARAPTSPSGTHTSRVSDAGIMTFADLLQGVLHTTEAVDASESCCKLDEQPTGDAIPAGNDQAQLHSEEAPASVGQRQFRVDVIPQAFLVSIDTGGSFQPLGGDAASNPAATSSGMGAWIVDPNVLPGAGPPEGGMFVVPVSQTVSAAAIPVDVLLLQQGQATVAEPTLLFSGDGAYAQQTSNTAVETLPLVLQQPVAGTMPSAVHMETDVSVVESTLVTAGSLSREGEQLKMLSVAVDPPNMTLGGAPAQLVLEGAAQSAPMHAAEVGNNLLYDQIIEGVRAAGNAEANEVIVHLKPEFLGRLSIRVLADEHGMRVEIKAEHEVVRQVMQDNLADLQSRLAEKGFSETQFTILADTGWQSRREPELPSSAMSAEDGTETENISESVTEPIPLVASGVIDYLA